MFRRYSIISILIHLTIEYPFRSAKWIICWIYQLVAQVSQQMARKTPLSSTRPTAPHSQTLLFRLREIKIWSFGTPTLHPTSLPLPVKQSNCKSKSIGFKTMTLNQRYSSSVLKLVSSRSCRLKESNRFGRSICRLLIKRGN